MVKKTGGGAFVNAFKCPDILNYVIDVKTIPTNSVLRPVISTFQMLTVNHHSKARSIQQCANMHLATGEIKCNLVKNG